MTRTRRALQAALALGIFAAAALHAIGEGRMLVSIVDLEGQPVPGVQIVLTRPGSNYKLEKQTDKKGQATLLVLDATQEYLLHLEKEGYTPYEETLKLKVGDTIRATFTIAKLPEPEPVEETAAALEGEGAAVEAFNAGIEAVRGGDVAGGLAKFQEAAALDPELPEAHLAVAEVGLEQGKAAEALAAADRFLALSPGDVRGLRARYDALKVLGDARSREALDALVAADPTRETAIRVYNEGAEAVRAGKREEAAALLQRALEVDPSLDPAYSSLAGLYLTLRKYPEAAQVAARLLERQPGSLEALTIRYEALKGMGDEAGAREALAALSQADVDPESAFKQGVAVFNANNMPQAIASFESVIRVQPEHAKAHYFLGLAYVNTGQTAEARDHLETFLRLAPDDPDAGTAREMLNYLK
jgi:tetratricopeptide (TPR) repeat protein